jgi:hypothetical protein
MEIRHTQLEDLPRLLEIYAAARAFMAANGNPRQWGATGWPPESLLREDIRRGRSYVCTDGGKVVGTFVYVYGPHAETTYDHIEDGAWPSTAALGEAAETYGVIHRLASDGTAHGVGRFCIEWAYDQHHHLRIDTHGDNTVMQHLLLDKLGFTRCGIIHVVEDNDPRIAFEKFDNEAHV